jgi:hypothetical protein
MSLAGEGVVAIWHDIAAPGRADFYAWHTHEHMPERVGIPGFVRGRRYIADTGEPEFFTLYEAVSVEVLGGQDYFNRLNNPTPWTKRAAGYFENVARSVQKVRFSAGPGIGGHLLTVRLEAEDSESFLNAVVELLTSISAVHGITGVHLCQTDSAVSSVKTAEKAAREGGTDMPGWTVMIEGGFAEAIDAVRGRIDDETLNECGAAGPGVATLYRLEYIRTKTAFA